MLIDELINNVREHAMKCDHPLFRATVSEMDRSQYIECHCGNKWKNSFSSVMESKEAQTIYKGLPRLLDYLNSKEFQKEKQTSLQKQKDEEKIRKNLEKRRNAIGSLEL